VRIIGQAIAKFGNVRIIHQPTAIREHVKIINQLMAKFVRVRIIHQPMQIYCN
jgi:hypothetical protein